eukprot:3003527-Rhodomonas_salina.2
MGATKCVAERRNALSEGKKEPGMMHHGKSHRPYRSDATKRSRKVCVQPEILSTTMIPSRATRSLQAFRLLGQGKTLGLKSWLIRKVCRKPARKQDGTTTIVKLEKLARNQSLLSKKSRGESASVLSDASTVPDEAELGVQDIWASMLSKAQSSGPCEEAQARAQAQAEPQAPPKPSQGTCIAIDCEMVGVGRFKNRSILARVAVVDEEGTTLLDEYVRPTERITDFRTKYSGIRPRDLVGAPAFEDVRQRVASLVRGKILIGHAVHNDLKVLGLPHPPTLTRDTSLYLPLRRELAEKVQTYNCSQPPSLKNLSLQLLGKRIQEGEHCPVQDAAHTMELYLRHRMQWEMELLLD